MHCPSCKNCKEILLSEYFVHQHAEMMLFIVVNRNKYRAVFCQQFSEEMDARPHHAEPLVVPFKVFILHRLALL